MIGIPTVMPSAQNVFKILYLAGGADFHTLSHSEELVGTGRGGELGAVDGHACWGPGTRRHPADVHLVRPGEPIHAQVSLRSFFMAIDKKSSCSLHAWPSRRATTRGSANATAIDPCSYRGQDSSPRACRNRARRERSARSAECCVRLQGGEGVARSNLHLAEVRPVTPRSVW